MGRRRKYENRPLGKPELRERFFDTLKNIQSMCEIYDGGNYNIFSSISTELIKLFSDGDGALIRNEFFYVTQEKKVSTEYLTPQMPLVYIRAKTAENGDGTIMHLHTFSTDAHFATEEVKFNIWWQKDIIFLASPPIKGTREKLTRYELIKLVRDKIGSHTDKNIPLVLDHLFRRESWGNVVASSVDLNQDFGKAMQQDIVLNTPIQAMVRQIAAETLNSIPME